MKTVKIKKIETQNMYGFANSKIEFSNKNTIIQGMQEQGKTTATLEALKFVFDIADVATTPTIFNKVIPNIDGFVEIVLDVDNIEYVLKRTSKQKYKNGNYDGQDNSVCFVNGIEHKISKFILQIECILEVDKKHFKYIIMPNYFNELSASDQRKYFDDLFDLPKKQSALLINDEFSLIREDLTTPTLVDEKTKKLKPHSTTTLKSLLRGQKISFGKTRTDLISKLEGKNIDLAKYDKTDFVSIDKELEKISTQLDRLLKAEKKEVKNEIVSEKLNDIAKLQEKINKFRQADMLASQEHRNECATQENKVRQLLAQWERLLDRNGASGEIISNKRNIEYYTKRLDELESLQFSGEITCTKCGQDLPKIDIETLINTFNERKDEDLQSAKYNLKKVESELSKLQADYDRLRKEYSEEKKVLDTLKAKELSLHTSEITALESDIETLNSEIANLKAKEVKADTADKVAELKAQQAELQGQNGLKIVIANLKKDIQNLELEIADITDKESLTIAKEKQLEKYIIDTIEIVNSAVNPNFENVSFRLFKTFNESSENDIAPDCEVENNGTAYKNCSEGQKVLCDMEVLSGLRKILGLDMFDIVDKMQSTNYRSNGVQAIYLYTLIEEDVKTMKSKKVKDFQNADNIYINDCCTKIDVAYKSLIEKLQNNGKEDLPTVEVE